LFFSTVLRAKPRLITSFSDQSFQVFRLWFMILGRYISASFAIFFSILSLNFLQYILHICSIGIFQIGYGSPCLKISRFDSNHEQFPMIADRSSWTESVINRSAKKGVVDIRKRPPQTNIWQLTINDVHHKIVISTVFLSVGSPSSIDARSTFGTIIVKLESPSLVFDNTGLKSFPICEE